MLYFDTGIACASCNAPVVRAMDADVPSPSCACVDEPASPPRPMGHWADGLGIGATLIALIVFAVSLHGCGAPSRALAPPVGCTWAPLPLRVQLDADMASARPTVYAAAEDWNKAMGRVAFVFVTTSPDVLIAAGESGSTGHRVTVTTSCQGPRAMSIVELDPGLDAPSLRDFAVHGLGHALGVAHSTNAQSVMQAALDNGLLAGDPGYDAPQPGWVRVTEHDAEAANGQKRGGR